MSDPRRNGGVEAARRADEIMEMPSLDTADVSQPPSTPDRVEPTLSSGDQLLDNKTRQERAMQYRDRDNPRRRSVPSMASSGAMRPFLRSMTFRGGIMEEEDEHYDADNDDKEESEEESNSSEADDHLGNFTSITARHSTMARSRLHNRSPSLAVHITSPRHGHRRISSGSLSNDTDEEDWMRAASLSRNFTDRSTAIMDERVEKLEDDVKHLKMLPWYIIRPSSLWKLAWDAFLLFVLFVLIIYIPFRLAFVDYERTWADWTVDVVFIVDLVLNLVTAVRLEDGRLVYTIPGIAWQYLRSGALLFDLIASIPLDLILQSTEARFTAVGKVGRIARVVRVVKLLKIHQMARLLTEIGVVVGDSNAIVLESTKKFSRPKQSTATRLCQVVSFAFLLTHILACLWWFLGDIDRDDRASWVNRVFPADPAINQSRWQQYLTSVYGMVAILSTVGLGDVTAETPQEMAVAVFLMLLGTSIFSFLTASLVGIVNAHETHDKAYREKMQLFLHYLRQRRAFLRPALRAAAISHMSEQWRTSLRITTQEEVQSVLNTIPLSLRLRLANALHGPLMQNSPMLRFCSDDGRFMVRLSERLVLRQMRDGDTLFARGYDMDAVYFVHSGFLDAFTSLQIVKGVVPAVASYMKDSCVGDLALLGENRSSRWAYRARGNTVLWGLLVDQFKELLQDHGYLSSAIALARLKQIYHKKGERAIRRALKDATEEEKLGAHGAAGDNQQVRPRFVNSVDMDAWDRHALGVAHTPLRGRRASTRSHQKSNDDKCDVSSPQFLSAPVLGAAPVHDAVDDSNIFGRRKRRPSAPDLDTSSSSGAHKRTISDSQLQRSHSEFVSNPADSDRKRDDVKAEKRRSEEFQQYLIEGMEAHLRHFIQRPSELSLFASPRASMMESAPPSPVASRSPNNKNNNGRLLLQVKELAKVQKLMMEQMKDINAKLAKLTVAQHSNGS